MIGKDVLTLSQSIELRNFAAVMDFGNQQQKELSDYSNFLSDQMAKLDDSKIRGQMGELLKILAQINLRPFAKRRFLFWWLPPKRPTLQQTSHYKRLLVELDYVAHRLEKANELLFKEIQLLDRFYKENKRYQEAITLYLEAGKHRYEEFSRLKFEGERQDDLERFLDLLDSRLYDLQMSGHLGVQKGEQIRMLQEGHRKLALKVQSSILNTIPLWQDQLSLALTLERQHQAAMSINELLVEQAKLVEALQSALRS